MVDSSRRIRRERRTVEAMLTIYCRGNHAGESRLCDVCAELLEYSFRRLDKCPLNVDKPTCAKCPTHCYDRDHRERVKAVMRYSGPRMILRHPLLAIRHLFDGLRTTNGPERSNASGPEP